MNEVNKMNKMNKTELYDIDTLYDCMIYAKLHPKEFIFWDSVMSDAYTYIYVYYDDIINEYMCYIGGNHNELFIMNFDNYDLLSKNIGYAIKKDFDFPMTGKIETLYDCIKYARLHPNHFVFWNTTVDFPNYIYYDDILRRYIFSVDNTEVLITIDTNYNLLSKNVGYKFLDNKIGK